MEYEQQLESQRDNLELLNQIVRHDIRNDIHIITAYAEVLSDAVDEENDYVEKILEASNDAVAITETARDITDVMLGEGTDLSAVNLRAVLEEEIDSVTSNYDKAVVTVDGSIPPVDVRADDMLDAVFRNLLTNAVQHNDKAVPEVTVSGTDDNGTARIQIADNGPGVPDSQKETIFEEGETALDSTGTGLGLYLVRTLLDRYDGDIRLMDNDPEGSVFVVTLPRFDQSP